MAKDDMYVLIYKVLSYLYDCMKREVCPDTSVLSYESEMLDVPRLYWARVMQEVVDRRLVRGIYISGPRTTHTSSRGRRGSRSTASSSYRKTPR